MGLREERGSALLLVPVLSLVAAICFALVVQAATAYVIWSRLTNTASTCSLAAARDVSVPLYEATGTIALSRSLATSTVTGCLAALAPDAALSLSWPGPRSITVSLREPAPAGLATWLGIAQGSILAHATATLDDNGPSWPSPSDH